MQKERATAAGEGDRHCRRRGRPPEKENKSYIYREREREREPEGDALGVAPVLRPIHDTLNGLFGRHGHCEGHVRLLGLGQIHLQRHLHIKIKMVILYIVCVHIMTE